jgi:hypothetical protein
VELGPNAQLALDTILGRPVRGVPSWILHLMNHGHLERLAGAAPGEYKQRPHEVYLAAQRAAGTCLLDQYLAENPLSMEEKGYEGAARGATTGAEEIWCDEMRIDSPEAVVAHLERVALPRLQAAAESFDEEARTAVVIAEERAGQERIGPDMLKGGYATIGFPGFAYGSYGYANYFMMVALYPEVAERHFALQADLALRNNRAVARAYQEADLPPVNRLDHDMADSRGMLVRIEVLDRIWFPHFARCLAPLLATDVQLIWHCDGNLMDMVPRLLEVGLHGFQGFQYEDGMDYPAICRMRTRAGDPLLIVGGVSVTRTLPFGGPAEVKRELDWLVEHGPPGRTFLGGSSSVLPDAPWENIATLVEGLRHYRQNGR